MATYIEQLYRQQWRRDLLWRWVEVIVALGACGLLSWALITAFGRGE